MKGFSSVARRGATFFGAAFLGASLLMTASGVRAADLGTAMRINPVDANGYIITLTANGQIVPRYPGSDQLAGFYYPSINIRRVGEPPRFAAPDDGFSISVLDDIPAIRFGPVVRFQSGRYFSDDRRLFGLDKLNWSVEPGAFFEYFPVSFVRTRLELRYSLNGVEGLVGNAGIDFIAPWQRFTFSLGPRIQFADANYMRDYFGVKPFESALNGRVAPYRPGGGLVSAGLLGSATYNWSDTWSTTGYAGYNRLVDEAAASPIPRRIGSLDQFIFGASLSYSFVYAP